MIKTIRIEFHSGEAIEVTDVSQDNLWKPIKSVTSFYRTDKTLTSTVNHKETFGKVFTNVLMRLGLASLLEEN